MVKTTTMPEHSAGNGRAERLIGRVKSQVRALLHGHAIPVGMWPHAVRYAVEGMQRTALSRLGHDTKPMVPFYSLVRFRARGWRDSTWGPKSVEGRLVAPCSDISKGYIARVMDGDAPRLYATTLVYQDFLPAVDSPAGESSGTPADAVFPTRVEMGRPIPTGTEAVQIVCEVSAPAPAHAATEVFAPAPANAATEVSVHEPVYAGAPDTSTARRRILGKTSVPSGIMRGLSGHDLSCSGRTQRFCFGGVAIQL